VEQARADVERVRADLREQVRANAERVRAVLREQAEAREVLMERVRADLVEQARANLIANHECEHTSWRSLDGSHQCEECFDILPNYIYECRQCRILACRRCRYNRL
jgi:hypothetical protein